MITNHNLSNARSSNPERPDLIVEVFDISQYVYRFTILPESEFWQLGFRFGMDKDFIYERSSGEFEWASTVFRDLYLSAENDPKGKMDGAALLHIRTSNFEYGQRIQESPLTYKSGTSVGLLLKFITKTDELSVSLSVEGSEPFEFRLPLYRDYKFFQVFAWFYKLFYGLQITSGRLTSKEFALDQSPFRVGEITFRKGDMFHKGVVAKTNLYVLPASANGTVTPNIYYRASELNIPMPEKRKAGEIQIFDVRASRRKLYAGYAYSVHNDRSSREIIARACDQLLAFSEAHDADIIGLSLPLLGTGAGGLDPRNVANLYAEHFNGLIWMVPVIVSIPSGDVFAKVKLNFIDELTPLFEEGQGPKPELIRKLENQLQVEIADERFELDEQGRLVRLDLSEHAFDCDLSVLATHTGLAYLSLNDSYVADFSFLERLEGLTNLYLGGTNFSDFTLLKQLPLLRTLDLSRNGMSDLEGVAMCCWQLDRLYLANNNLRDAAPLAKFKTLEFLDMSYNFLTDTDSLSNLRGLRNLLLACNQLLTIDGLGQLKHLAILNVRDNRIEDLSVILQLKKLRYLIADKNSFVQQGDLLLTTEENHLPAVAGFYARQAEEKKEPLVLPAKVLLLGNHGSGKTSLRHYLLHNNFASDPDSTHIIEIDQYRFGVPAREIPDAILFDFGGQDYYHGLYRAFLSAGSLYLLLWNETNNLNQFRQDKRGLWTQDFTLNYWLAQKQYLEREKEKLEKPDSALLVQTFADRHRRLSVAYTLGQGVENEFYVALSDAWTQPSLSGLLPIVNDQALAYLRVSLNELIRLRQTRRSEPRWYHDFIAYILWQQNAADHHALSLSEIAKHYNRPGAGKLDALKTELQQLHRQGLILYYRTELTDLAWLNPVAVVRYVHETVLSREQLARYHGRIPMAEFINEVPEITAMLIEQKVIFKHGVNDEFIVPNFLRMAKKAAAADNLMVFGLDEPAFVLKFGDFVPFGLMNQIICFFGELPEQKIFWRDRLVFVLEEKAKVLINLDLHQMEINVFLEFTGPEFKEEKARFIRYLFYGIIGLYWDMKMLRFKEFGQFDTGELSSDKYAKEDKLHARLLYAERLRTDALYQPEDLYVSLDGAQFVHYRALCNATNTSLITAYQKNKEGVLILAPKAIPIYPFQPFTANKLRKERTVVISYSKEDLEMVNKFRDYLVPLHQDGLIESPWYCTFLQPGDDWNEEIKKHFEEAELIFFMVSENLMKIPYVMEHEIKTAIDRYNKYKNVKVVPIIMQPYHWQREGQYNLAMFSGLPYTLKAVSSFPNQHEAWHVISESIRIMLVRELDPGVPGELPRELRKSFEKIVRPDKV